AKVEIEDKFPDEHLMILKAKLNNEEPWDIIVLQLHEEKFTKQDSIGPVSLRMLKTM
ncbi:hypothetical protein Tco_0477113, partial [Tanacetum coccineum]